jgi:hypothetical protein
VIVGIPSCEKKFMKSLVIAEIPLSEKKDHEGAP